MQCLNLQYEIFIFVCACPMSPSWEFHTSSKRLRLRVGHSGMRTDTATSVFVANRATPVSRMSVIANVGSCYADGDQAVCVCKAEVFVLEVWIRIQWKHVGILNHKSDGNMEPDPKLWLWRRRKDVSEKGEVDAEHSSATWQLPSTGDLSPFLEHRCTGSLLHTWATSLASL